MEARRDAIKEALRQPKSQEEDKIISLRYANMSAKERAFNILLDLGLIELSPDPEDPNYYPGNDEDYNEEEPIAIEAAKIFRTTEEKPKEEK
jgi:Tfp pilus assembly protein FimV